MVARPAVSCAWGYTTTGGAKGVGESTTSAVVISLVLIFVFDFALRWEPLLLGAAGAAGAGVGWGLLRVPAGAVRARACLARPGACPAGWQQACAWRLSHCTPAAAHPAPASPMQLPVLPGPGRRAQAVRVVSGGAPLAPPRRQLRRRGDARTAGSAAAPQVPAALRHHSVLLTRPQTPVTPPRLLHAAAREAGSMPRPLRLQRSGAASSCSCRPPARVALVPTLHSALTSHFRSLQAGWQRQQRSSVALGVGSGPAPPAASCTAVPSPGGHRGSPACSSDRNSRPDSLAAAAASPCAARRAALALQQAAIRRPRCPTAGKNA